MLASALVVPLKVQLDIAVKKVLLASMDVYFDETEVSLAIPISYLVFRACCL